MTDVKALLGELRNSDPKFDEAQAVVDLVRSSGDMLERMRERKGWSQSELAEHLGVTTGRVSQLESGTLRNAPSLKMMARFAQSCGEKVKLVASGDSAYAQSSDNVHANMNDIMGELAALRAEVQALRAAVRSPEPRQTVQAERLFAPAAFATPIALAASEPFGAPRPAPPEARAAWHSPLMAASDAPTRSPGPPLQAKPTPARTRELPRIPRREEPEAEG